MSMMQVWDRDCMKLLLCFSPGLLYAIGGFDGVSPLRSGEQFDIGTNKWTPIPDMNTKRFGLGACACEGEEAKLPAVHNFNLSLLPFLLSFPSCSLPFSFLPLAHILRCDLCSGWI